VLDLLVLLALHVRKRAKDGVDSFRSRLRSPSQSRLDDMGTFLSEQVGEFLTEALVSSNQSVSFPDTDTNGFMAGFQQTQGNTVADDACSTRNENRTETRVKCEFPQVLGSHRSMPYLYS
jgi:hypothetical protein